MATTSAATPLGTTPTPIPAPAERDTIRRVLGPVIGLALLIGLIVTAFALPAVKAAPHDLPIGVAGPAAATGQVSQLVESKQPGAFAVTTYGDEATLRTAILDRDVYGGLAIGATGPKLLLASAGSPAVATALTGLAQGIGQAQGVQVASEDVVPLPTDDPHGAGLATALLPMLIGAISPVVALVRLVRRPLTRVLAVLATNLTVGFTAITVLHYGLGTLTGSYLLESLTMSLTLAAISMALLGLHGLLGWVGLGLGALRVRPSRRAPAGTCSARSPTSTAAAWGPPSSPSPAGPEPVCSSPSPPAAGSAGTRDPAARHTVEVTVCRAPTFRRRSPCPSRSRSRSTTRSTSTRSPASWSGSGRSSRSSTSAGSPTGSSTR